MATKEYKPIPKWKDEPDWGQVLMQMEDLVENVIRENYPGRDHDYYMFEAVVKALFEDKQEFWDWWNSKNMDY